MANKIKLKRGAFANLPTLDVGEPAFTTDTHDLYLGSADGNVNVSHKSNPNILLNPFFTVNQYNTTSGTVGTTNTKVIDHWDVIRSNYSITSEGFSLAWDGTNSTNGILSQRTGIPNTSEIVGKYVTFSAIIDGVLRKVTGPVLSSTTQTTATFGSVVLSFFYNANYGYICQIQNSSTTAVVVKAAKLEIGTDSTLLNDIEPEYGMELIKCITHESQTGETDPRSNYPVFWSNPNLLDNPWFTINQRNITSGDFSHKVYRFDRWFTTWGTNAAGTWELTDGILTLNASSNSVDYFAQQIPDQTRYKGKVLTASVLMSDGTIYSGTTIRNSSVEQSFNLNSTSSGTDGLGLKIGNTGIFYISVQANKSVSIKAVKLEIGPVSTLCNDTAPDYETELAKCQYYYQKITSTSNMIISIGHIAGATNTLYVPIKLTPMRTQTPGITIVNGVAGTTSLTANTVTKAEWMIFDRGTGFGSLKLTLANAMTLGDVVRFGLTTNGSLVFNSEFN